MVIEIRKALFAKEYRYELVEYEFQSIFFV
jgi:hypothetical protein